MAKIRYVGTSETRIIEPYVWNKENGYVQEIADPDLLENLLTYPRPDFELVEEPKPVPEPEPVKDDKKKKK